MLFRLLLLLLLLLPCQPPVCVGMGMGHGTKECRFIESLGRHEANHLLQVCRLKKPFRPMLTAKGTKLRWMDKRPWPLSNNGLRAPYVEAGLQTFYASLHASPISSLKGYCELLCCARRPGSQIARMMRLPGVCGLVP